MESAKNTDTRLLKKNTKVLKRILVYAIILLGLIYLGHKNFLMFHVVVETTCIVIAFTMTSISINTYKMNSDNRILFLGIAYGFVSCFDLLHTISYKGMSAFTEQTANLPTQLWIIARYMESLSFLLIIIFPNVKFTMKKIVFTYSIVSIILLFCTFHLRIFPDCFLGDVGLTSFKIISEYIISVILLVAIIYLLNKKNNNIKKTTKFILFSLICTIISEIFFVFYISVYDFSNLMGHVFKLISFYLVYIALVESNLKEPYFALNEMNRLLNYKNQKLKSTIFQLQLESEKRQKVESENLREKEILNAILDASEDGVLVIGNDKKVIQFNSKCTKMWSTSYEIVSSNDASHLIKVVKNQLVNPEELEITIKNVWEINEAHIDYLYLKTDKVYEVISLPFIHKNIMAGRVFTFRDITEKKKIEELQRNIEIKQAMYEKAKEYNEMKSSFFSTISHEFKTPINIILGIIQLVINLHKNNGESLHYNLTPKYVKMMKQNCNRILKLVNNIVDITRIDSGFMQMNFKNYNIVSTIEDITLSIAEYAESKGISLVFDTHIEEKIISCDADKLERVMLNLLSNSIKFTETGGKIEVNVKEKDDKIVISVKDTGVGIPSNMIDTVFDRFRQVDSSLRRKKEGSGIGLSLVKSLVELHGGKIRLNSEVGKGSEFIIELPENVIEDGDIYNESSIYNETNIERIHIEFSDIYF